MHELAMCQALLAQVEAIARQHAATVNLVRVGIGPLSGVDPGQFERAYALACAGTAAEGSALAITGTPVRVRCRTCGVVSEATVNRLLCAACADWRTELAAGDEMLLLSVELSEGPQANPGGL